MQKTKRAKKRMSLIMAFALMLTLFALAPASVSAAGDASKFLAAIEAPATDSIPISNATQLAAIGKDSSSLSRSYHLTNDIDLSGVEWTPVGTATLRFTGTFDGQGYVIKNLTITSSHSDDGLFRIISGATIKNVGLEETYIDISAPYSSSYAGGICGYSDSSTISNCYNIGHVSVSTSSFYARAGGICGYGYTGTTISDCYNTGDVSASSGSDSHAGGICGYSRSSITTLSNCYNSGDISASSSSSSAYAGGICGYNYSGISDCYNAGKVSASSSSSSSSSYTGGICGYISGVTISNCYNTGDVSAFSGSSSYAGGICGYGSYSTISNCYWNSDSAQIVDGSAQTSKKGVGYGTDTTTPLTSAQMKMQASFVGFDFDAVWEMVSGKDYPQLRGSTSPTLPTTYAVTVSAGTGATGGGNYEQGDTVNITAGTAPTGQRFKNWTTTSDGVTLANPNSASTSFTMPANAVTVTANFEDISTDPEEPEEPGEPGEPDEPEEPLDPLKGHVLGNDNIGIGDAQLAFRAALKLVTLVGDPLDAADLDGNGTVEISEAMRIFRYALKLSNVL